MNEVLSRYLGEGFEENFNKINVKVLIGEWRAIDVEIKLWIYGPTDSGPSPTALEHNSAIQCDISILSNFGISTLNKLLLSTPNFYQAIYYIYAVWVDST